MPFSMNIIKYNYLKFKHWLNFQPPYSLTMEEWNSFNEDFEKNAPIRYYIKHNLIPKFFVINRYVNSIRSYIIYRFIEKYHILDTGLEPNYYDRDTRILHSCFNTLKDFVEVEKAMLYLICDTDEFKENWKFKIPFYRYFYRNKEYGLKYLEWETTLDDPSLPLNDRCESQAEMAREIIKLYNWWTREREENHKKLEEINDYTLLHETEKKLNNEDDEMLIRLIKIRRSLWT